MAGTRRSKKDLLGSIKKIRVKNNDLWMEILAIALECNPIATKQIIKDIATNDTAVALTLGAIAYYATNDPD